MRGIEVGEKRAGKERGRKIKEKFGERKNVWMKFGAKLARAETPLEWRDSYLKYTLLKTLLGEVQQNSRPTRGEEDGDEARPAPHWNPHALEDRLRGMFWAELEASSTAVQKLHSTKLEEAKTRFAECIEMARKASEDHEGCESEGLLGVEEMAEGSSSSSKQRGSIRKAKSTVGSKRASAREKISAVEAAFVSVYHSMSQLQEFCVLNAEGFAKITARFAKSESTRKWVADLGTPAAFHDHTELLGLMTALQEAHATRFCGGNQRDALRRLVKGSSRKAFWTRSFPLGVFTGFSLSFSLLAFVWGMDVPEASLVQGSSVFILFRAMGLALLLLWMWSLDALAWSRSQINFGAILGFNPKSQTGYQRLLLGAAVLTLLWLLGIVLYLFCCDPPLRLSFLSEVPPQIWPLAIAVAVLVPFVIFEIRGRGWLLRILCRIAIAPFHAVSFEDTFMADQLVSIAIVVHDIEFSTCFYSVDVWRSTSHCLKIDVWTFLAIAALPSLWRLLQCLRLYRDKRATLQLFNAGKYLSTILVSVAAVVKVSSPSNATLSVWFGSILLSTAYSFIWDVFFDWNLFTPGRSRRLLRDVLLFEPHWIYWAVILVNLVLRFTWALTLSPKESYVMSKLPQELLRTTLACGEIFRRGMWNVLRLEAEQIKICSQLQGGVILKQKK